MTPVFLSEQSFSQLLSVLSACAFTTILLAADSQLLYTNDNAEPPMKGDMSEKS